MTSALSSAVEPPEQPRFYHSLLFFALMSGPPRLRLRDAGASLAGQLDLVSLMQIGVWMLGFAWIAAQILPRARMPRFSRIQLLAFFLLLAMALSAIRSVSPLFTGFVVFQYMVMLFFAHFFVRRFGVETFLTHAFWTAIVLAAAICLAVVFAPHMVMFGGATRVRGDLIVPTDQLCVIALTLLLYGQLKIPRLWFWILFAGLVVLLLASRGRTGYLAFAIVVLFGFVFMPPTPVRRLIPVVAIGLLGMAYFVDFKDVGLYFLRGQDTIQKLSSMSARVPLWTTSLEAMWERSPVIGLGYYAGSRALMREMGKRKVYDWQGKLGDAHSGYMEVIIGAGILGGVLLFFLLISLIMTATRLLLLHGRDPPVFTCVALLGVMLIIAATSSNSIHIGTGGFTFWSLMTLIPVLAERHFGARRRQAREARVLAAYADPAGRPQT